MPGWPLTPGVEDHLRTAGSFTVVEWCLIGRGCHDAMHGQQADGSHLRSLQVWVQRAPQEGQSDHLLLAACGRSAGVCRVVIETPNHSLMLACDSPVLNLENSSDVECRHVHSRAHRHEVHVCSGQGDRLAQHSACPPEGPFHAEYAGLF